MIPLALPGGWRGAARVPSAEMPTWHTFLERLSGGDSSLAGQSVLKHSTDRRVIRWTSPAGEGEVVGRWTRSAGFNVALDVIRGSAGRRDFQRTVTLLGGGVGSANPLAFLERRGESWLVTEFLADAADLDRVVLMMLPRLDARQQALAKRRISVAAADFFAALIRGGWRHRDLKASNLLIVNLERVVVVDWEGLRRRRLWNGSPGREAIVRLTASLLESPHLALRDLARFLRDCSARSLIERGNSRETLLQLLHEAQNYNRAAKGRKTHKLDGIGAG